MRELFRSQMREVQNDVIELIGDVSVITRKAVASLVEGDVKAAQEVIDGDAEFDARCLAIEERVLEIIATQFPVASDLRLLYSLSFITIHLERMADLAANIAKAARRTAGQTGGQTLNDLIQAQGNLVYRVIDATKEALANRDLELALKLPELDEPIDHLYKQFFRELSRLDNDDDIAQASKMILSSRYLERIADHSVDIGDRIAFLITGERALPEDS